MRTLFVSAVVLAALIAAPVPASAQTGSGSGSGSGTGTASPRRPSKSEGASNEQAATTRVVPSPPSPASVKNLSNVQIELTISDQTGTKPVEKKTVSMIAANGTWGKVRASGVARPNERIGFVPVGLNVDARPFVFADGTVQIELTISYNPLSAEAADASPGLRPTELNQSMTVALQTGKPLVVSQAADPVSDRKIIVEVKATILK